VYVYLVQGDTLAVSAPIEIRDRVENLVIIESGVKAGDRIVAQGTGKLRDNTPIQPQTIAFDSIANSLNTVFK
jgi:membrane fusion protein (multidrug efflux system)